MNKPVLKVSLSPHTYGPYSAKQMMFAVIFALMPAFAMAIYAFGLSAIKITLISVLSCVLCEYAIQKFLMKTKTSVSDGSAALTGILLAFNLPSNLPSWMVVVGAVVAIGIGKMSFGGLGNNPFNPALVGRVFMLISFPVDMTSWPKPLINRLSLSADAVTAATPLMILKEGVKGGVKMSEIASQLPNYWELFSGTIGGCIGEVSACALLIGGAYLLWKKNISWHIPVSMIGAVFIFSGIFWLVNPEKFADPFFQILTGGVMLGAIFMATDYVTSPMTYKGMLIYGSAIGILTVLIRTFGAYPEGVSFAILIMNAFVPLINRCCKPKRFGE